MRAHSSLFALGLGLLTAPEALAYDVCQTRPGVFDLTSCDPADPAACMYSPDRPAGAFSRYPAAGVFNVPSPDLALASRTVNFVVNIPSGVQGPMPVVILSHGGSLGVVNPNTVMQEWFGELPKWGYVTVVIAHSGTNAQGLCDALGLVGPCPTGPGWDRTQDVGKIIDWLAQQQALPTSQLFGKVDLNRIGVLGHSAGASNAAQLGGMRRIFGVRADGSEIVMPGRDPRVQVVVALSAPGPSAIGVPLDAFEAVDLPFLVVSSAGDDDGATNPAPVPYGDRAAMYDLADGQEQYRLFFDDLAVKHETVNLKLPLCTALAGSIPCRAYTAEIGWASLAFLDAYLQCDDPAMAWLESDGAIVASGGVAQFDKRDPLDADLDRVPDPIDVCPGFDDRSDADLDGAPDGCDACPVDPFNDRDGDGACDSADPCPLDPEDDADADGACSDVDPCPLDPDDDFDGDGVCADLDLCPLDPANDGDGDGVCGNSDTCPGFDDHVDLDADGTPDACDVCPLDPHNDSDGDGACDSVDACPLDPADDFDGDGLCADVDACPLDGDNDLDLDLMCADVDPCPADAQNDADGDGFCEIDDNCATVANDNQADADVDGIGDACEPDSDGDGVVDDVDNCVFAPNESQLDLDGDGTGDVCDADADGDLVADGNDACLGTPIGEPVLANGCSVDQQCPCAAPWKNHGGYMSCIEHAAEALDDAGVIDEYEREAIKQAAEHTTCGQKPKPVGNGHP